MQSETGWFSYNMLENLKDRVKVRFLSVFPEPGSEHLLKAATESFKKSKKMCSKDDFIRAEVIQPEDNAGTNRKLHLWTGFRFFISFLSKLLFN